MFTSLTGIRPAHIFPAALALLVLSLALAACDAAEAVDPAASQAAPSDLGVIVNEATADLHLSAEQSDAADAISRRYAPRFREPGTLWRVAGALHEALSDEQIERLQARQKRAFEEKLRQMQPGDLRERIEHRRSRIARALSRLLTEDQRAEVQTIRQETRAALAALAEQRRSGALTPEAFLEEAHAVREAARAEVDALLTDEQRAKVEAWRERRDEAQAVRIDVLGLTDDQQAALKALRTEQAVRMLTLADAFHNGDDVTRGDLRAALEEGRAARRAILTDDQQEIIALHRGLMHRARQRFEGEMPLSGKDD